MSAWLSKALSGFSLFLRQPLWSFCDVETSHGDALVTKRVDYVTVVRIDGTRRPLTAAGVRSAGGFQASRRT